MDQCCSIAEQHLRCWPSNGTALDKQDVLVGTVWIHTSVYSNYNHVCDSDLISLTHTTKNIHRHSSRHVCGAVRSWSLWDPQHIIKTSTEWVCGGTIKQFIDKPTYHCDILQSGKKWNESGFRPLLCTYRLNWARRTSRGWWDDTALQTQDSKFKP